MYKNTITVFILLMSIMFSGFIDKTFALNTVAVVPFDNINKAAAYEWLSVGICETLSTDLARIENLTLVERHQVNKILNEVKLSQLGLIDDSTVQKVGKLLGAEFLIVGAFQLHKSQIRITARFIDVETGKIERTAKVDGNLEEIFLLEDKLVTNFTNTFNISTSPDEESAIKSKPTDSLQAFEKYSKGMQLIYAKEGRRALEFLRQATDIDPLYEEAQSAYETYSVTLESNEIYKEALENIVEKNRAIRKSLETSDRIRHMLKSVFRAYLTCGPSVMLNTEHELVEDKVNLRIHAIFVPPHEAINKLQNIAQVIGPPSLWSTKDNMLILQGSGCDWAQFSYARAMKQKYAYKSPYYKQLPLHQKREYISRGDCIFDSNLRPGKTYPLARFLRGNWSDCPYLFKYYFILRIIDGEGKDVTSKFVNRKSSGIDWKKEHPIVEIKWGSAGFVNFNTRPYRRNIKIYSNVNWNFKIRNITVSQIKDIAKIELIPAHKIFENDPTINIRMMENPDLSGDSSCMKNIFNDKIWENAIIQTWQKLHFQI